MVKKGPIAFLNRLVIQVIQGAEANVIAHVIRPRAPHHSKGLRASGGPNVCGTARKFRPIPGNRHEAKMRQEDILVKYWRSRSAQVATG